MTKAAETLTKINEGTLSRLLIHGLDQEKNNDIVSSMAREFSLRPGLDKTLEVVNKKLLDWLIANPRATPEEYDEFRVGMGQVSMLRSIRRIGLRNVKSHIEDQLTRIDQARSYKL